MLIKYDEKSYLRSFVSKRFDFLQYDSTNFAAQ